MNEPLNPCPFCNTTPILQHTRETGFYIHCPGCKSYTHGAEWSREEALAVWNNRPDPWVRIDPERPESLPKASCLLLLSCVYPTERAWPIVCMGYWDNFVFENQDGEPLEKFGLRVIAYQPWPEPAPYPGDETP